MRWWKTLSLALRAATRDERAEEARCALLEALHASPYSLAIGGLSGLLMVIAVTELSRDPVVIGSSVVLCLVALIRISVTLYIFRTIGRKPEKRRFWGRIYDHGVWIFSATLGANALIALMRTDLMVVHMLAICLATGYAGAIADLNAGRPRLAIGQACAALLPASLGLWMHGGTGYRVLAIMLLVMVLGLTEIVRTIHNIVMEEVRGKQEKAELAREYEYLARYDSLTGVENRMAMHVRLRDAYTVNRKAYERLAVIGLDIDHFKDVNDTLGHQAGDELLRGFVRSMKEALRGRGHIARVGGDEFVVLCPDVDRSLAEEIASDMIAAFAGELPAGEHWLRISASIGIAVGPQDGRDADELLRHADIALYQAKARGRNQAVSFSWEMQQDYHRTHQLQDALRQALELNQLSLRFQPIFDVRTGRIAACEALLRWRHPHLGSICPEEFIPIAENIGMIEPITRWVIERACKAAAQWPDSVRIAVNISPSLLKTDELPRTVIAALMESGLSADRLDLEVTESVFLEQGAHMDQMLCALRRIGLRLVLDDFGTGYSSLNYLRRYHFDALKIDRSFMKNAADDAEDRAIIRAIRLLADALSMEIVAEGVETPGQLAYAREVGLDQVQGFLMSTGQTESVATDMVRRGVTIADAALAYPGGAQLRRA